MGLLTNAVTTAVSIEVGAADVDFATDLGEGDDALTPVVLPGLGRDSEQFTGGFGFESFGISVGGVACLHHLCEAVEFVLELLPFFLRNHDHCHSKHVLATPVDININAFSWTDFFKISFRKGTL